MDETYLWIGGVSHEHERVIDLDIAQFNHGKRAVLARMQRGYR